MIPPHLGPRRRLDQNASSVRSCLLLLATLATGWIECDGARAADTQTVPPPRPTETGLHSGGISTAKPDATLKPALLLTGNSFPSATTNLERRLVSPASLSGQAVFIAQVALSRQGISPGSIDGLMGPQTRAALRAFQQKENLTLTSELDEATRSRLTLEVSPTTNYVVTSNDLARLRPLSPTWLGKSQQDRLDYETLLELVAEKSYAHPNLVRRLNPGLDWTNLLAGAVVLVPNVDAPSPQKKAAWVRIHLAGRVLEAFDEQTNLLAHFPCSIAQRVDKRPAGELRVAVLASSPNYTFDPEVFPESAEAHELGRKLVLQPGPNNPVGTVWIGLDKPGYGIHGTPRPEQVGRTESHGCFRLANWNAEYLLQIVRVGTPVLIEP